MFLTKAEQRAQEKKSEKKAAEDPFNFLVDVRDVSDSGNFDFKHARTLLFLSTLIEKMEVHIHVYTHSILFREMYALHSSFLQRRSYRLLTNPAERRCSSRRTRLRSAYPVHPEEIMVGIHSIREAGASDTFLLFTSFVMSCATVLGGTSGCDAFVRASSRLTTCRSSRIILTPYVLC